MSKDTGDKKKDKGSKKDDGNFLAWAIVAGIVVVALANLPTSNFADGVSNGIQGISDSLGGPNSDRRSAPKYDQQDYENRMREMG